MKLNTALALVALGLLGYLLMKSYSKGGVVGYNKCAQPFSECDPLGALG
jgi:hypothetical protein